MTNEEVDREAEERIDSCNNASAAVPVCLGVEEGDNVIISVNKGIDAARSLWVCIPNSTLFPI